MIKLQAQSNNHRRGFHLIAAFEALKGFLVLAAGFGLLRYIHHDLQTLGEHLVIHLHLPKRYSSIFLQLLSGLRDQDILLIAALSFAYSILRFVEAYGLWQQRNWAQWLAIISGAIYLPVEFYGLYHHINLLKSFVTFLNILLLVYLTKVKFGKK